MPAARASLLLRKARGSSRSVDRARHVIGHVWKGGNRDTQRRAPAPTPPPPPEGHLVSGELPPPAPHLFSSTPLPSLLSFSLLLPFSFTSHRCASPSVSPVPLHIAHHVGSRRGTSAVLHCLPDSPDGRLGDPVSFPSRLPIRAPCGLVSYCQIQIRRKKNVKKGIQFCLMVCGASGTGMYPSNGRGRSVS